MAAAIYNVHKKGNCHSQTKKKQPTKQTKKIKKKQRKAGKIQALKRDFIVHIFSPFILLVQGNSLVLFITLVNLLSDRQYNGSQFRCWTAENEKKVLLASA